MGVATYPLKSSKAGSYTEEIRIQGTGAAHPTRELGQGVTITRTAVGVFRVQWAENPGLFVGMSAPALRAATMGDVKNCSVTPGVYDATNRRIDLSLWSSAGAARELAANEYIDLAIKFAETTA